MNKQPKKHKRLHIACPKQTKSLGTQIDLKEVIYTIDA